MDKSKVYDSAVELSIELKNREVYVWENSFGEWKYSVEFPMLYSEIIAVLVDGKEVGNDYAEMAV